MPLPALATIAPYLATGAAALGSGIAGYFGNKNSQPQQPVNQQIPRYSPNQQNLQNKAIESIMGQLNQPGGGFAPIEKEYQRKFDQDYLPSIGSRFNSAFGQGQRNGSGFKQFQTQASQDLASQLAAMKANFQNNQYSSLLNFAGQPNFDTLRTTPNNNTEFGSALEGLSPYIGVLPQLLQSLGQNNSSDITGANPVDNKQTDISELFGEYLRNQSAQKRSQPFGEIQPLNFRQAGF